ncbi:hypothetical protein LJY25_08180 [Hymenobacter sp. BT175]|uniref:GREB1-related protein n=1 Tax=Hymenobacter translucens TaxID=2886507 RepID=UPI001D0E390B|nr:hypothetical protein [Hymenobacter translucens]MCC2546419.1 hypothetical protein [Hymenobacter translucens]
MQVKVVIPSHKRAGRILTLDVIPDAIVCIPESQLAEYRRAHPGTELVTHPDSVVGLAAKRNWMYHHFGDMLQLDDDITDFRRMYLPPGEKMSIEPARAMAIIQETAYAAKQAGAYLWGFSSNPNPTMFKALNPISLTGYVTGCATGLLKGSKLWYNSQIICNEDYWISCLNAYHHRLIWKDMRFTFIQKDTFVGQGGLAEFRNLDAEQADYELLRRCFGDVIQKKKDNVLAKRKHQFQKTLKIPF